MQCGGGVGRNMAEALWKMRGGRTRLITAIGNDADGRYLDAIAPGLLLNGCVMEGTPTASYSAVLDSRGACLLGLGDMDSHQHISPQLVDKHLDVLEQAPLVVLDGNAPQATIDHVLELCHQLDKPVFFEPTDRRKAIKSLQSKRRLAYASPNLSELKAMANFLEPIINVKETTDIDSIIRLTEIVSKAVNCLIVTLDIKGVLIYNNARGNVSARLYPVKQIETVVSASGAGDCFSSGFIHALLNCCQESHCISTAFESAKCSLLSRNCVPEKFNLTDTYFKEVEFEKVC